MTSSLKCIKNETWTKQTENQNCILENSMYYLLYACCKKKWNRSLIFDWLRQFVGCAKIVRVEKFHGKAELVFGKLNIIDVIINDHKRN